MLAFAVILAVCAWVLVLRGEITRGPVLPLALVLYLVAATRGRRAALTALAASLALLTVQGVILSLTGRGAGNAVSAGLSLIICWMIGYSVGQRRGYAARLQQQAMDNAITAERLRIARELHDVVAHSMTVVAVQGGFGEYVFDRQPGEARAALAAIQTVTSEALADMQRMLGALRQARGAVAGDAAPGPAAGVADRAGSRHRPPLRWRPRPAWPTWTGWWRARPGPASGSRCCEPAGQGHPGRHRPVGVPDRPGGADQRGETLRRGSLPGAHRLRRGPAVRRDHRPGQPPAPAPAAGARAPAMAGASARAVAGAGGTGAQGRAPTRAPGTGSRGCASGSACAAAMDVRMPVLDGIEATRRITAGHAAGSGCLC